MPIEKIYYAVVIFIAAISILLSPFFYIRRPSRAKPSPQKIQQQWCWIFISNLIILAALATVWYFWLL